MDSKDNDKPMPEKDPSRQEAFTGQGNNYQAGGDIYIGSAGDKPKGDKPRWLGTTESIVVIVSTVIAIFIALYFTIPDSGRQNKERAEKKQADSVKAASTVLVTGIIRDAANQAGIPGAFVTSDLDLADTVRTTTNGTFQFNVRGILGDAIRIYAGADHYRSRDEYHKLGSAVDMVLNKK